VVKDGKQQADQSFASTVFDIEVGALQFHEGGQQIELTASLQDYSDLMSWHVFLQAAARTTFGGVEYSGVMLSTYEADGDDRVYPDQDLLTCEVMIAK
jgi:hypothetical protein